MADTAKRPDLSAAATDKPWDTDFRAEQSVLGAMLLEREALARVLTMLTVDDLTFEAHRTIFLALKELFEAGQPVDVTVVSARLQDQGRLDDVGGQAYLARLMEAVPTTASAVRYAERVREMTKRRDVVAMCEQTKRLIVDGDLPATVGPTESAADQAATRLLDELVRYTQRSTGGDTIGMAQLMGETANRLEAIYHEGARLGVPSGLPDLDDVTGGWRGGELIVLGADTSQGKTSTLARFADAADEAGVPVLWFSLEQGREQIGDRIIARAAGLDHRLVRMGDFDSEQWEAVVAAAAEQSRRRIFLCDKPALDVGQIHALSRLMMARERIGLVLVDYLQVMRRPEHDSEYRQLSMMIQGLHDMTRSLGVPVIVASQLSREAEHRTCRRPRLSDLRGSGVIEECASVVVFVYRPGGYQDAEEEIRRAGYRWPHDQDIVEFIVAKNRQGERKTLHAVWHGPTMSFRPCERRHAE
jgi:replicative DNA helicase